MAQKNNNSPEIQKVANKLRTEHKLNISNIVNVAKKDDLPINWRDLYYLSLRYPQYLPIIPHPFIGEFLKVYFLNRKISRAINPCAGPGVLLTELVKNGIVQEGLGIIPIRDEFEAAQRLSEDLKIKWLFGNMLKLKGSSEKFDLAISFPPLVSKQSEEIFTIKKNPIKISDQVTNLEILRSCILLKARGEGIFVLPNSFFWNGSNSVYSNLERFELYPSAVFSLQKVLFPLIPLDLYIVVIGRREHDELFVAQIEPTSDLKTMIRNMRKRKPGKAIEQGKLVDPKTFLSWRDLVLDVEIEKISRKGMQPILISDIAEEINLGDLSEDGGFKDQLNDIYLPVEGNSPTVTDLKDFQIEPINYIQIILRPELANADYVAGFFNTTLGHKIRERLVSMEDIPKITKKDLLSDRATVLLPHIDVQNKICGIHRSIREITLQLEEFEKRLWKVPSDALKVEKEIINFDVMKRRGFESWIESLPFPLASILWLYYADVEPYLKNRHLLHFFEALAIFVADIMLSAYYSDKQFFEKFKSKLLIGKDLDVETFLRGSFGNWIVVGERLAKFTRRMLSREERNTCMDLFRVDTTDLLDVVASKDLFATLKTVNEYRNDWKGHGGIVGKKEELNRLNLLERELTRVREIVTDSFEDSILITPTKSKYIGGIYYYTANNYMGTRTIFRKIDVESPVPMENGKMYLLDKTVYRPLEIMPFFRIMSSPKTEGKACYFFNRVEKSGIRWISYHYEQDPDIIRRDKELQTILEELTTGLK